VTAESFFATLYALCGIAVFLAFLTRRPYTADVALVALSLIFAIAAVFAVGSIVLPRLT
jgi:hypothetical protein